MVEGAESDAGPRGAAGASAQSWRGGEATGVSFVLHSLCRTELINDESLLSRLLALKTTTTTLDVQHTAAYPSVAIMADVQNMSGK